MPVQSCTGGKPLGSQVERELWKPESSRAWVETRSVTYQSTYRPRSANSIAGTAYVVSIPASTPAVAVMIAMVRLDMCLSLLGPRCCSGAV